MHDWASFVLDIGVCIVHVVISINKYLVNFFKISVNEFLKILIMVVFGNVDKIMPCFFLLNGPHLADLVIELPCPWVCLSAQSGTVFFKASHWPWDHMTSSRPLIGPPPPPWNSALKERSLFRIKLFKKINFSTLFLRTLNWLHRHTMSTTSRTGRCLYDR